MINPVSPAPGGEAVARSEARTTSETPGAASLLLFHAFALWSSLTEHAGGRRPNKTYAHHSRVCIKNPGCFISRGECFGSQRTLFMREPLLPWPKSVRLLMRPCSRCLPRLRPGDTRCPARRRQQIRRECWFGWFRPRF
jgi:hypothetical protein